VTASLIPNKTKKTNLNFWFSFRNFSLFMTLRHQNFLLESRIDSNKNLFFSSKNLFIQDCTGNFRTSRSVESEVIDG